MGNERSGLNQKRRSERFNSTKIDNWEIDDLAVQKLAIGTEKFFKFEKLEIKEHCELHVVSWNDPDLKAPPIERIRNEVNYQSRN